MQEFISSDAEFPGNSVNQFVAIQFEIFFYVPLQKKRIVESPVERVEIPCEKGYSSSRLGLSITDFVHMHSVCSEGNATITFSRQVIFKDCTLTIIEKHCHSRCKWNQICAKERPSHAQLDLL